MGKPRCGATVGTRLDHVRSVWREEADPETRLIAIDPGDRWTGVAFFSVNEADEWYCQDAIEMGRIEFEDALTELVLAERKFPIVVYERFRLYGDKANEQKGSEFDTSQLIGVIKYIVRLHNDHAGRHDLAESLGRMMTCELSGGECANPALRPHKIELIGQVADIKKPTAGILRKKGIKSVAKPIAREHYAGRDHIVDAELHGWKHILDTMGGVPATD